MVTHGLCSCDGSLAVVGCFCPASEAALAARAAGVHVIMRNCSVVFPQTSCSSQIMIGGWVGGLVGWWVWWVAGLVLIGRMVGVWGWNIEALTFISKSSKLAVTEEGTHIEHGCRLAVCWLFGKCLGR